MHDRIQETVVVNKRDEQPPRIGLASASVIRQRLSFRNDASMMNDGVKRLLFLTFSFPPSANVSVFRALRFSRYLPEFGWTPMVVASEPDPRSNRLDSTLVGKIPSGLVIRRTPIRERLSWLKTGVRALKSVLRSPGSSTVERAEHSLECQTSDQQVFDERIRQHVSWFQSTKELLTSIPDSKIGWKADAVVAGIELIREYGADAILASGPPFTVHLAARDIAHRTGLPLVLDFRDPWSRPPWGPRTNSRLAHMWECRLERSCVRDAAIVVLNTERMAEEFRSIYADFPREKFVAITNGIDPEFATTVEEILLRCPVRDRCAPFCILHPGSLYRRRDPRPLISAIANLARCGKRIRFEQYGHVDSDFDLRAAIASANLTDLVEIYPPIPHAQMLEHMATADAFALIQPDTTTQVPGKLYEMMLFRKPILALTPAGALSDVVRQHQLGIVASPNAVTQIEHALNRLLETRDSQSSVRSSETITEFDGRRLTGKLAYALDGLKYTR